jgi:hypothetical protein
MAPTQKEELKGDKSLGSVDIYGGSFGAEP